MISNAKAGMVTGALLAIARITGETAPILVTARYSYYWALSSSDPTASLPVAIWFNALDQSATAQQQAWGAALVLIILVLSLNIVVRLLTRRNKFNNSNQMVKKSWLRKSKQSA
jgi:phosphate transport system permease protein